jgi:molybdenum ABC transporter molybdate-binding protein
MAKLHWATDWKVGIRVWIERAGDAVLGEGRAELLAAIESEHSITKAARSARMSYRRAWNLIQQINEAAGVPLVESAVGGPRGGGARLTERGRTALNVYQQLRRSLVESSTGALRRAVNPNESTEACIHLAAAISLQEAVNQILAEYALERPAVRVRAIFGASNELADQLLAGAPGDLFISAEPGELDRLVAAKLVTKNARQVVARNGLAIVGAPNAPRMAKPSDLLATRIKRVAAAEPACPLGKYSKAYLVKSRVYDKLLPKILQVNNSRAVLAAVASGAAQAGVAFSSDASGQGAWKQLFAVPTSQAATTYVAALVGRGRKHNESQGLYDFVSSPAAARCYRRCGLRRA